LEKFDFSRRKIVGLVFDLSIRHDKNGQRIIDLVKESLKKRVVDNDEDLFFFVSNLSNKMPKGVGETIQQIDSYDDPIDFNYGQSVKYIINCFDDSVEDVDKIFLAITDRFDKKYKGHYKSVFDISNSKNMEIKVIYLGVGNHYDKDVLEKEISNRGGYFAHVDDLKNLIDILKIAGV